MSVLDRIKKKREAEKAVAPKTETKKEAKAVGRKKKAEVVEAPVVEEKVETRGRKSGVKYTVPAELKKQIDDFYASYDQNAFELRMHVGNLLTGTKSAAAKAREAIQENVKISKDFRKALQEAKEQMEELEV